MRIFTVEQIRDIEARADAAGYSYKQMMEAAGKHVADVVSHYNPSSVVILVGPGNNGGDGLVAAGFLASEGINTRVWLSRERDALHYLMKTAKDTGVVISQYAKATLAQYQKDLSNADIIVDALLGTGATPPLRGTILEMVQGVHALHRDEQDRVSPTKPVSDAGLPTIVAIDGPSGLDFDTGEIDDRALTADTSVTFASPKFGHILPPGSSYVGDLIIGDIGLDHTLYPEQSPQLADPDMIRAWLPERSNIGHKGSYGKVLIAAGSANYTGAAVLASLGAYRAGAGLVTLALPASLHTAVVSAIPEATYLLLPEALGTLDESAARLLKRNTERYSALLVGPGLSNTRETQHFLRVLLDGSTTSTRKAGFLAEEHEDESVVKLPPMVLDADGLNIISTWKNWWQYLPASTILTPHPGEMSRLTGKSIAEIESHRIEFAQQYAKEWGHVVLLKGANTVVGAPDGQVVISPFANSALSTAGSGDVLAGITANFLGQGCAPFKAAICGAYVHALAGTLASEDCGQAGVIARDIANYTAQALNLL